jgi:hypothetical protein
MSARASSSPSQPSRIATLLEVDAREIPPWTAALNLAKKQ